MLTSTIKNWKSLQSTSVHDQCPFQWIHLFWCQTKHRVTKVQLVTPGYLLFLGMASKFIPLLALITKYGIPISESTCWCQASFRCLDKISLLISVCVEYRTDKWAVIASNASFYFIWWLYLLHPCAQISIGLQPSFLWCVGNCESSDAQSLHQYREVQLWTWIKCVLLYKGKGNKRHKKVDRGS